MHITTHSGRDIKMTMNHVLPAGKCSLATFPSPSPSMPLSKSPFLPLVYASRIAVGDCIMTLSGQEEVMSVEHTRGEGVYTIVTNQVTRHKKFNLLLLLCVLNTEIICFEFEVIRA